MRFPPHFQLFYFNDRLEFCEFFEWKINRINNADLFSQPPLLIFTKGANISGGHCINILETLHLFAHVFPCIFFLGFGGYPNSRFSFDYILVFIHQLGKK